MRKGNKVEGKNAQRVREREIGRKKERGEEEEQEEEAR